MNPDSNWTLTPAMAELARAEGIDNTADAFRAWLKRKLQEGSTLVAVAKELGVTRQILQYWCNHLDIRVVRKLHVVD